MCNVGSLGGDKITALTKKKKKSMGIKNSKKRLKVK